MLRFLLALALVLLTPATAAVKRGHLSHRQLKEDTNCVSRKSDPLAYGECVSSEAACVNGEVVAGLDGTCLDGTCCQLDSAAGSGYNCGVHSPFVGRCMSQAECERGSKEHGLTADITDDADCTDNHICCRFDTRQLASIKEPQSVNLQDQQQLVADHEEELLEVWTRRVNEHVAIGASADASIVPLVGHLLVSLGKKAVEKIVEDYVKTKQNSDFQCRTGRSGRDSLFSCSPGTTRKPSHEYYEEYKLMEPAKCQLGFGIPPLSTWDLDQCCDVYERCIHLEDSTSEACTAASNTCMTLQCENASFFTRWACNMLRSSVIEVTEGPFGCIRFLNAQCNAGCPGHPGSCTEPPKPTIEESTEDIVRPDH
jgi:hypothetical protein